MKTKASCAVIGNCYKQHHSPNILQVRYNEPLMWHKSQHFRHCSNTFLKNECLQTGEIKSLISCRKKSHITTADVSHYHCSKQVPQPMVISREPKRQRTDHTLFQCSGQQTGTHYLNRSVTQPRHSDNSKAD